MAACCIVPAALVANEAESYAQIGEMEGVISSSVQSVKDEHVFQQVALDALAVIRKNESNISLLELIPLLQKELFYVPLPQTDLSSESHRRKTWVRQEMITQVFLGDLKPVYTYILGKSLRRRGYDVDVVKLLAQATLNFENEKLDEALLVYQEPAVAKLMQDVYLFVRSLFVQENWTYVRSFERQDYWDPSKATAISPKKTDESEALSVNYLERTQSIFLFSKQIPQSGYSNYGLMAVKDVFNKITFDRTKQVELGKYSLHSTLGDYLFDNDVAVELDDQIQSLVYVNYDQKKIRVHPYVANENNQESLTFLLIYASLKMIAYAKDPGTELEDLVRQEGALFKAAMQMFYAGLDEAAKKDQIERLVNQFGQFSRDGVLKMYHIDNVSLSHEALRALLSDIEYSRMVEIIKQGVSAYDVFKAILNHEDQFFFMCRVYSVCQLLMIK